MGMPGFFAAASLERNQGHWREAGAAGAWSVRPALPPRNAPGGGGGGGPHGGGGGAAVSASSACHADCDGKFAACMGATAVFAPFLIPVCVATHNSCGSACDAPVISNPIGVIQQP